MTIQQAGAYALGSLADDWLSLPNPNAQEAQVCIDILCTYLRTHHHTAARAEGRPAGDDYDYTIAPADQPVRDSIQRILTNHLRDGEEPGVWSALNLDLTGAHLHFWEATGTYFTGTTLFTGAHFTGTTWFTSAYFTDSTSFTEAHFISGSTHFDGPSAWQGVTVDWEDAGVPEHVWPKKWPPRVVLD
ncbi:pentapeptide repeat-containing protein [Gordonia sp. N1V]|uniref:pentapeptide repeat-containing protein n=1 Tax=Gordonia sp. N1V TaxID=3034163 RepID=UPI0023E289B5|nr:pentapeptide repeat-containing protein [Gordonia sp. N1V]MDF3285054.1 pentapeptide repeat-containing protein [Gordonia sp. N1V]